MVFVVVVTVVVLLVAAAVSEVSVAPFVALDL